MHRPQGLAALPGGGLSPRSCPSATSLLQCRHLSDTLTTPSNQQSLPSIPTPLTCFILLNLLYVTPTCVFTACPAREKQGLFSGSFQPQGADLPPPGLFAFAVPPPGATFSILSSKRLLPLRLQLTRHLLCEVLPGSPGSLCSGPP